MCRNHAVIAGPAQLDLPGSLIFQEGKCIEGDYYIVWPSALEGTCHVSLLHVLTFSITFLAFCFSNIPPPSSHLALACPAHCYACQSYG